MASGTRKATGQLGETIAAQYLVRKGFKIIGRNYRKPWGEIDIIAEKDATVRFVEVKTVTRESSGNLLSREIDHEPEELVDNRKLRKVARTASLYMEETRDQREYQIDVVGVILNNRTKTATCRLFEQVLGDRL